MMPDGLRRAVLIDLTAHAHHRDARRAVRDAVAAVAPRGVVIAFHDDKQTAAAFRTKMVAGVEVRVTKPGNIDAHMTSLAANLRKTGTFSDVSINDPWPNRRVLLIDIENQTNIKHGPATLRAALSAAGSLDLAVASAHSRFLMAGFQAVCADLGIELVRAKGGPDGADNYLLGRARTLHAAGVEHFVVLSADHAFADLPGTVTVLHEKHTVSRRLVERAQGVIALTAARTIRDASTR